MNPKTFKERDAWIRALNRSGLPSTVIRLGVQLAMHLNVKCGRCDPSYPRLAAGLLLSKRSIIRMIGTLEGAGWVSVASRGKQHQPNQFFLFRGDQVASRPAGDTTSSPPRGDRTMSPLEQRSEVTNSVARGDNLSHPEVTSDVTRTTKRTAKIIRGGDSLPPDSLSPGVTKTDAKSKAAACKKRPGQVNAAAAAEAFARFWSAYPKRVAKEAALRAFAGAVERGADAETLIRGAKAYAVARQDEDPRYTKHPATWLHGGCWTDEAPGAAVLDNDGRVVAFVRPQPQPQRQATPSPQAIVQRLIDERYPGNKWS